MVIKEYRQYSDVSYPPWDMGLISVNLAYVSTVSTYESGGDGAAYCYISVVGMPHALLVGEEYTRFLRDWHSVKR